MLKVAMGTLAIHSDDDRLRVIKPRRQGFRTLLVALLVASLVGTGVSIAMFFVPGAVVAAMCVGVCYGMLVAVRIMDRPRRSDATPRRARAQRPEPQEIHEIADDPPRTVVAAERAGLRIALVILAPLLVLAVVLGGAIAGWEILGLGALAFFAIMVFMGAPVWLAAVEDEIEEEEERAGFKQEAIR